MTKEKPSEGSTLNLVMGAMVFLVAVVVFNPMLKEGWAFLLAILEASAASGSHM